MASSTSISFDKREEVDEVYLFPIRDDPVTQNTQNSSIMVEYQDDGTVLIIAGNIPGMRGYFKNYPDVVEGDEQKEREHKLAKERLDCALEKLSEYDPKTSHHKANSGNIRMRDIYVEVPKEQRDEVILQMWQVLNDLRTDWLEYVKDAESESYVEYDQLEDEILEIIKRLEIKTQLLA